MNVYVLHLPLDTYLTVLSLAKIKARATSDSVSVRIRSTNCRIRKRACLVPRRLKCVWKTENATASDSIAQWTMGKFSVDAKDARKDAFPIERGTFNRSSRSRISLQSTCIWLRGRKRAENYLKANHDLAE